MLSEVKVPITKERAITGVVVGGVKFLKFFVCKIRNVTRLPSRIEPVLRILKQVLSQFVHESIPWIAHCAFHFVVDYTAIHEAALGLFGIFKFKPVSLLSKIKIV